MVDIQVSVKAKIYWDKPCQDNTEKMLREHSQVQLDSIASSFNNPLREILKSLRYIKQ